MKQDLQMSLTLFLMATCHKQMLLNMFPMVLSYQVISFCLIKTILLLRGRETLTVKTILLIRGRETLTVKLCCEQFLDGTVKLAFSISFCHLISLTRSLHTLCISAVWQITTVLSHSHSIRVLAVTGQVPDELPSLSMLNCTEPIKVQVFSTLLFAGKKQCCWWMCVHCVHSFRWFVSLAVEVINCMVVCCEAAELFQSGRCKQL